MHTMAMYAKVRRLKFRDGLGIWRNKVQLAQMKLCASRAVWLVANASQGHEMWFDAHTRCLAGLDGVSPGAGSTTTWKTRSIACPVAASCAW